MELFFGNLPFESYKKKNYNVTMMEKVLLAIVVVGMFAYPFIGWQLHVAYIQMLKRKEE